MTHKDKQDVIAICNILADKMSDGGKVAVQQIIDAVKYMVENEPCEDYISRTEALKVIEEQKKGYYGVGRYAIDECNSAVMKLPSVTPKQTMWIPCSERLPEDEQDCLITYEGMGKFHIKIATYSTNLCKVDKYNFHTKKDISGFYGYDGEWGYFEWSDVVAWMPLPKPYKESEDRNDDT